MACPGRDAEPWVLCTDYVLWATKVAGPAPLVEALLNNSGIEAVRLPCAPDPTMTT